MAKKKQTVYGSIAQDILSKIKSGTYAKGSLLPPERVLMEQYGVERTTVRRGLDILKNEGYITKVAGLGSVVNSEKKKASLPEGQAFSSTLPVISVGGKIKKLLIIYPHIKQNTSYNKLSFISSIEKCFENICSSKGVTTTFTANKNDDEIFKLAESGGFDGVIAFDNLSEALTARLEQSSLKVLFALGKTAGKSCVMPNISEGVENAVYELLRNRHSAIAFIGSDESSYFERTIRLSFINALKLSDTLLIPELINTGGNDEKSGFDRFSELIRRSGGKFTAVCTVNDETAKGAIKAAKYYNLNVPEDVSIISLCSADKECGFDRVYCDAMSIAAALYCIAESSFTDYGMLSLTEAQLIGVGTVSVAKDISGTQKRLSDFLL